MIRESYGEQGGYDDDDDNLPPDDDELFNGIPDFNIIFGAPDLTALINKRQTANAKEYTGKTASLLKALALGSLQAGNFPDAATILWHGPGAATAVGNLCDENERVAQIVDMVTSPSNAWTAFALAALPLVSQLFRNHEKELEQLPARWKMGKEARAARKAQKLQQGKVQSEPRFTIKFGKWKIPVRFNAKFGFVKTFLGGVRTQTQEPNIIAAKVFMDADVLKALEKIGIVFRNANEQ